MVLLVALRAPRLLGDELTLYLVIKGGFVILLAIALALSRGWQRCGFGGGMAWRFWPLLLPAWLSLALSLVSGIPDITAGRIIGWLALGLLIGLGEETIFRGACVAALAGRGPRFVILFTALLFGAVHLAGIGAGVDPRMAAAQAVFAAGLGVSFAWVRLASGSIWPCIIAHAAMDGIGLAAADGVGNALRYNAGDFPAALATAAASMAWALLLLSRTPPDPARRGALSLAAVSPDEAAAGRAVPAIPGEDRAG